MKCLVIESNRDLLNSIERFLMSKGHEVTSVFDGVIALNNLDSSFDVIFIDKVLPRLSSSEIIDLTKKKHPLVKVVLLIDTYQFDENVLINNKNINEYLRYPFLDDELDWVLSQLNKKSPNDIFLTYKEEYLIDKFNENKALNYKDIDSSIFKREEINIYISALNKKFDKLDLNIK